MNARGFFRGIGLLLVLVAFNCRFRPMPTSRRRRLAFRIDDGDHLLAKQMNPAWQCPNLQLFAFGVPRSRGFGTA